MAIGGLKEKVLAAYRHGIRTVILPMDNKKDMVEIPPEIKKAMTFKFFEDAYDVIRFALEPKK